MARGKQTCKILKEIRKQIAAENDIKLVIEECTYQGDCLGTCPKCEAEVRYLERELEKRQRMGKAAIFAGMTLGTAINAASCGLPVSPTPGLIALPTDSITAIDTVRNDSVDKPFLFEGDVVATVQDSLEEEGETLEGIIEDPVAVDEGEPYMIVEQMPEFPDGEEAMMQYIAEQVKYPAEAKKAGAYGRVFIGFIVEPDGSLSDIKVLRGMGYGCDEEALRVVKSMPKWQPGMHRGKAVRVQYLVPVNFRLEEKQD
ncbi:MAG: energy transducer TonB [Bacteroidales bacterium]|nr:energy transducer TonB [Bacteroidales bacterium]